MKVRHIINPEKIGGFLRQNKIKSQHKKRQNFSFQKRHLNQNQHRKRIWQFKNFVSPKASFFVIASVLIVCILISPTLGVSVDSLKAPIKDLKETVFGGWMWVPKIGAAVGGCLMAVYNQSIMPLATGAGIGLGIHFYDLYIKAEGALI